MYVIVTVKYISICNRICGWGLVTRGTKIRPYSVIVSINVCVVAQMKTRQKRGTLILNRLKDISAVTLTCSRTTPAAWSMAPPTWWYRPE